MRPVAFVPLAALAVGLHQVHAAFRALAGFVTDHFGMHRAGIGCVLGRLVVTRVTAIVRLRCMLGMVDRLGHVLRLLVTSVAHCGCFPWDKAHAAFRAIAGFVADHFGVHRAGVFDAHFQRCSGEIGRINVESARFDDAAQLCQSRPQPILGQRRRYIGHGQRRNIPGAEREDRPWARHLGIDDGRRILQTLRDRADDDQDPGVARRADDD